MTPPVPQRTLEPLAKRRQQHDWVRRKPSRQEGEHVGRCPVQPLGIVGDDQHRGFRRHVREQLERGERRQKQVRGCLVGHAEGRQEGVPLGRWQRVHSADDRAEQLVKPGEGKPSLSLDTGCRQDCHSELARVGGRVSKDRGLADPRLAEDEERAPVLPCSGDQIVDVAQFLVASEQRHRPLLHSLSHHVVSEPQANRCRNQSFDRSRR